MNSPLARLALSPILRRLFAISSYFMVLTLASLVDNAIPLSLGCAAVGLIFALWLVKSLLSIPAGTEKMQFIANAIEQGGNELT